MVLVNIYITVIAVISLAYRQQFKHRIVHSLFTILSNLANLIVCASIGHSFGFWERPCWKPADLRVLYGGYYIHNDTPHSKSQNDFCSFRRV